MWSICHTSHCKLLATIKATTYYSDRIGVNLSFGEKKIWATVIENTSAPSESRSQQHCGIKPLLFLKLVLKKGQMVHFFYYYYYSFQIPTHLYQVLCISAYFIWVCLKTGNISGEEIWEPHRCWMAKYPWLLLVYTAKSTCRVISTTWRCLTAIYIIVRKYLA